MFGGQFEKKKEERNDERRREEEKKQVKNMRIEMRRRKREGERVRGKVENGYEDRYGVE
jgi:hypothetical protein